MFLCGVFRYNSAASFLSDLNCVIVEIPHAWLVGIILWLVLLKFNFSSMY